VIVTNAIPSAMQSDPRFEEEFHWENLDAVDISDDSLNELRDSIVQKYRSNKLDVIVLLGPDPLRLMLEPSKPFYLCVVWFPSAPIRVRSSDATSGISSWTPSSSREKRKSLDNAVVNLTCNPVTFLPLCLDEATTSDSFVASATSSRAGVAPAEVQRLSRRTIAPTI
jgi:hypothetical protein